MDIIHSQNNRAGLWIKYATGLSGHWKEKGYPEPQELTEKKTNGDDQDGRNKMIVWSWWRGGGGDELKECGSWSRYKV